MFKTLGILGTGNMGRAIASGLVRSGLMQGNQVYLYNLHPEKAQRLADELGAVRVDSAKELLERSEAVILAVKPFIMPGVLEEIKPYITSGKIMVSIAAGLTLSRLAAAMPEQTKIVRVMPNTPAMVGEGMSALTFNTYLTEAEKEAAVAIFRSFGKAEVVEERLIDAVCGLSGSGPAFVYMFIEAMADAAVNDGMPRAQAYKFAAQSVLGAAKMVLETGPIFLAYRDQPVLDMILGAAKMVLETGEHPGKLKDDVCSPGGTTIEAVKSLEENGFRAAAMNAVIVSAEKNKTL